jgi:hypothetical protein
MRSSPVHCSCTRRPVLFVRLSVPTAARPRRGGRCQTSRPPPPQAAEDPEHQEAQQRTDTGHHFERVSRMVRPVLQISCGSTLPGVSRRMASVRCPENSAVPLPSVAERLATGLAAGADPTTRPSVCTAVAATAGAGGCKSHDEGPAVGLPSVECALTCGSNPSARTLPKDAAACAAILCTFCAPRRLDDAPQHRGRIGRSSSTGYESGAGRPSVWGRRIRFQAFPSRQTSASYR